MSSRRPCGARRTVHVVHAIGDLTADCLVEVMDTACGTRPVIVRWPLVSLRFESIDEARRAFSAFGQFGDVRSEIVDGVNDCIAEVQERQRRDML